MNPMTPLTAEQLRDLAPSYVLGMLDADERAAFDRGLQTPECREVLERELATHRAAAELMATAHAVAPPPGLKARMMQRIAEEKHAAVAALMVEPVAEPVAAAIETPRETVTDNVRELAMARRAEVAALTPMRAEAVRQSPASRATRAVTPPTPTAIVERSARRTARTAWWTAGVLGTALAAAIVIAPRRTMRGSPGSKPSWPNATRPCKRCLKGVATWSWSISIRHSPPAPACRCSGTCARARRW